MVIKTIDDGKRILKKHYDKQLRIAEKDGVEFDILWIKMKYKHSLDVYDVAGYLLSNEKELSKLDEKYKSYGKLGALLHDIGRAYEIGSTKINGVKHGYFGAENILKAVEGEDNPFLLLSMKYHDLLNAIENTEKELKDFNLSEGEQKIALKLLKLVMDSDKLANFKFFQNCDRKFFINLNVDLYITEKCFEDFKNKKLIRRSDMNTIFDQYLFHISWAYDLNFEASKDLVLYENYMGGIIKRMLNDIQSLSSVINVKEIEKLSKQLDEVSAQLKNDRLLIRPGA